MKKGVKSSGRNQKFTDDLHLNYELKCGNWRRLIVDGQTVEQLFEVITDQFMLDEYISKRLAIYYNDWSDRNKKRFNEFDKKKLSCHILDENLSY